MSYVPFFGRTAKAKSRSKKNSHPLGAWHDVESDEESIGEVSLASFRDPMDDFSHKSTQTIDLGSVGSGAPSLLDLADLGYEEAEPANSSRSSRSERLFSADGPMNAPRRRRSIGAPDYPPEIKSTTARSTESIGRRGPRQRRSSLGGTYEADKAMQDSSARVERRAFEEGPKSAQTPSVESSSKRLARRRRSLGASADLEAKFTSPPTTMESSIRRNRRRGSLGASGGSWESPSPHIDSSLRRNRRRGSLGASGDSWESAGPPMDSSVRRGSRTRGVPGGSVSSGTHSTGSGSMDSSSRRARRGSLGASSGPANAPAPMDASSRRQRIALEVSGGPANAAPMDSSSRRARRGSLGASSGPANAPAPMDSSSRRHRSEASGGAAANAAPMDSSSRWDSTSTAEQPMNRRPARRRHSIGSTSVESADEADKKNDAPVDMSAVQAESAEKDDKDVKSLIPQGSSLGDMEGSWRSMNSFDDDDLFFSSDVTQKTKNTPKATKDSTLSPSGPNSKARMRSSPTERHRRNRRSSSIERCSGFNHVPSSPSLEDATSKSGHAPKKDFTISPKPGPNGKAKVRPTPPERRNRRSSSIERCSGFNHAPSAPSLEVATAKSGHDPLSAKKGNTQEIQSPNGLNKKGFGSGSRVGKNLSDQNLSIDSRGLYEMDESRSRSRRKDTKHHTEMDQSRSRSRRKDSKSSIEMDESRSRSRRKDSKSSTPVERDESRSGSRRKESVSRRTSGSRDESRSRNSGDKEELDGSRRHRSASKRKDRMRHSAPEQSALTLANDAFSHMGSDSEEEDLLGNEKRSGSFLRLHGTRRTMPELSSTESLVDGNETRELEEELEDESKRHRSGSRRRGTTLFLSNEKALDPLDISSAPVSLGEHLKTTNSSKRESPTERSEQLESGTAISSLESTTSSLTSPSIKSGGKTLDQSLHRLKSKFQRDKGLQNQLDEVTSVSKHSLPSLSTMNSDEVSYMSGSQFSVSVASDITDGDATPVQATTQHKGILKKETETTSGSRLARWRPGATTDEVVRAPRPPSRPSRPSQAKIDENIESVFASPAGMPAQCG